MDAQTARAIREEVAAAERRITQHLMRLIQQTTITNPTTDGNEDGADGWPDAGKRYQRSPRRMQHFGFRSVPPKNVAAIMALVGGGSSAEVTVAEDGDGYGPDPGAEGVALFSAATGCYITLDGDGQIRIIAPANQNITVETSGTGQVNVTATAVTGAVNLGPAPVKAAVLVQGTTDGVFGAPVINLPSAAATIVKSG